MPFFFLQFNNFKVPGTYIFTVPCKKKILLKIALYVLWSQRADKNSQMRIQEKKIWYKGNTK